MLFPSSNSVPISASQRLCVESEPPPTQTIHATYTRLVSFRQNSQRVRKSSKRRIERQAGFVFSKRLMPSGLWGGLPTREFHSGIGSIRSIKKNIHYTGGLQLRLGNPRRLDGSTAAYFERLFNASRELCAGAEWGNIYPGVIEPEWRRTYHWRGYGSRHAVRRIDTGFNDGGHGVDLRQQHLHAERCAARRFQLSGDYRDGECGGECEFAADEFGERCGRRIGNEHRQRHDEHSGARLHHQPFRSGPGYGKVGSSTDINTVPAQVVG